MMVQVGSTAQSGCGIWGKMMGAVLSVIGIATPAASEIIRCTLANDVSLEFAIERAQFSPAIDAREPPKINTTTVLMNGVSFVAEPFVMIGARGFWADAPDGGSVILTVQDDGVARFANVTRGERQDGTCTSH